MTGNPTPSDKKILILYVLIFGEEEERDFWNRLGVDIELQHIHPREYLACSFVKMLFNTIDFISNKPITMGISTDMNLFFSLVQCT